MSRLSKAALVLIAYAGVASGQQTTADATRPEVTATGHGEVQVAPTRAAISVTTSTKSSSAAQAASENARLVALTRSALRNAGVAETDLRNVSYGVGMNYDSKGKPDGFIARYTIRVETSDLQNVGRIVDAALGAGANEVSSIQFFVPNTDDQRRAAMAIAVSEARRDAEAIARAAGGSLGRLISITAYGPGQPGNVLATSASLMSGMSPTYIPPGDLTIAAQAAGRWEFVPAR